MSSNRLTPFLQIRLLVGSLLLLTLIGCASVAPASTPTATATQPPTETPTPMPPTATHTSTPIPTFTPFPTETQVSAPASPTPVPTASPTVAPTEEPSSVVQIAAVGDIMLDRTLGIRILDGDAIYPFRDVREQLLEADFTIGNLESALGETGEPFDGKSFPFQAPPEAAEVLADAGFDLVSLANNHAMDYGPDSLLEGIDLLDEAGVASVGGGADREEARTPHIVKINGVTFAYLAYVNVFPEEGLFDVEQWDATETEPGVAWGRVDEMQAEIEAIRPEVDHVIVILHYGFEYVRTRTVEQAELGRAAIDAGATAVIGHHSHLLQEVEWYKGGMIVYGLGNFAFDIEGDNRSAILNISIDKEGIVAVEAIPVIVKVGGAPRLATEDEAEEILPLLGNLSRFTRPDAADTDD